MGRATRGCGCAIAVLLVFLGAMAYVGYRYALPWWRTKPPPPSGRELQVHILDVGPINGDSILIISPAGKTVLIDAGDTGKGKVVLEALKRQNIEQLDYFIATHPHPDHIGAADEVFKAVRVLNVIDNGIAPVVPGSLLPQPTPTPRRQTSRRPARSASVTKFFDDYKSAVAESGAQYETAEPGKQYDLGGGARLTIFAPSQPHFTRDHMRSGGNETNANSVVARLDYGDFSMLLPADAEEQTEHRLLTKDVNLKATILKIAHHGSKYATSGEFLKRVQPQVAIVSCGEWNRYGHPAPAVLERLRSQNAKLYRTDLHGEISISTKGRANDYVIKTAKEPSIDIWEGRIAQKDDSSRAGFIAYGDFGPPPKPRANNRNTNR
ncbi:MAG TPA: ComEC/Rec2 family competence protein [Pyrinomonadaceae bacterium]|nr:ComEC/Rec2 family competence protein [Pyrinomonadaceae bacterium]